MSAFNSKGPIVAISTGTSEKSALGIVRVSGFEDFGFLEQISKKKGPFEAKKVHFTRFFDQNDQILDEGLFVVFQAPHSFTGENIVEFNLHGNPLLLERFVQHLVDCFDFRRAAPGEFSYRAMANEKLNLTQIEGLDLLLNANSGFGLKAGTEMLHNDLFKEYKSLRNCFLEMKSSLEILIDFSEDVGEEEIKSKLERDLQFFRETIDKLKKRTKGRISDALAPSIGLFGQTNAGKSTLFNKLYGEKRAIVSNTHGTTRDYVSENITIKDQSFKLIDTAGLRETSESVEKEGIEKSLELLESSFYKILVINPFDEFILEIPENIDAIVLSHSDLDGFEDVSAPFTNNKNLNVFKSTGPMGAAGITGPIGPNLKSGSIGAKNNNGPIGPLDQAGSIGAAHSLSGPIGPGKSLEYSVLMKYQELTDQNPIPVERHRIMISDIYGCFNEISATYENTNDVAILSSYFNRLGSFLDQLVGVVSPQDVLDHIFENFCIGK